MKEVRGDLSENGTQFPCFFSVSGSGVDAGSSKIDGAVHLDEELKLVSGEKEPDSLTKSINALDPLLYIYTSGTTGLPKAVNISHLR